MLAEVAAITGVPYVFFPSLRKNLPCEILAFGVLRSAVYYMNVHVPAAADARLFSCIILILGRALDLRGLVLKD